MEIVYPWPRTARIVTVRPQPPVTLESFLLSREICISTDLLAVMEPARCARTGRGTTTAMPRHRIRMNRSSAPVSDAASVTPSHDCAIRRPCVNNSTPSSQVHRTPARILRIRNRSSWAVQGSTTTSSHESGSRNSRSVGGPVASTGMDEGVAGIAIAGTMSSRPASGLVSASREAVHSEPEIASRTRSNRNGSASRTRTLAAERSVRILLSAFA